MNSKAILRFSAVFSVVFSVALAPQVSFGWGKIAHEIVAEVAAEAAYKGALFWESNSEIVGQLTTVPDRIWKVPATYNYEKYHHFFEPDGYFKKPADFFRIPRPYSEIVNEYGDSHVRDHGTAPWRATQLYNLALKSFVSRDYQEAVEFAGTMSHYIADLSQPLHVTVNYDGQMTDQEGVHAWFETNLIAAQNLAELKEDVRAAAIKLLRDPDFVRAAMGDVYDVAFEVADRSYPFVKKVLSNDKNYGRRSANAKTKQLNIAVARMADGAATLAVLFSRLADESGLANEGMTVRPTNPAWVPTDFSEGGLSSEDRNHHHGDSHDDCYQ